ncbi:hypothetical protein ACN28E_09075 [Archangium lansingense]|uniref:hypothetical protein n=1 Tax=Archangium lansingense TaxID=2995310 RepID=UPI003B776640
MMTKAIEHPLTIRELLFGGIDGDPRVLMGRLEKRKAFDELGGVLHHLSRITLTALEGEIATTLTGLLEMDLGELILMGFLKYRRLKAAARNTVVNPDRTELVTLNEPHVFTSVHKLRAELLIDGRRRYVLHFNLTVTLTVKNLVARVSDGRLVSLSGGQGDAEATLKWERFEIARAGVPLKLPLVVRLGDGFPLLTEEERAQVEEDLDQEQPAH